MDRWTKYFSKEDIKMASKHMKSCSTSLTIKQTQIKPRVRYYFTPISMAIIKKTSKNKCWRECGDIETLIHCWWECKMVQPLWKTVCQFLKRLKELSRETAIPLLGIYPREIKEYAHTKTYTWTFIVALVIIAQTWKKLKCLSSDKWINKVWYIHTTEYYLVTKRNEVLVRATS